MIGHRRAALFGALTLLLFRGSAQGKKLGGKEADAYIAEGYFYLDSGESARAQKEFEAAIAVDTASPFGYHHMGAFFGQNGRYPEAEKYFRLALEKLEADPKTSAVDLLHTLGWLGDVIEAQGRYPEAEAVYLKGLAKAESSGTDRQRWLHSLANIYASEGSGAKAEATYKRAAAECPARSGCKSKEEVQTLLDMGRFYLDRGRRAEAEAAAASAEKVCWDLPVDEGRFVSLNKLSFFYAKLDDVSKNEALYARLLPLRRARPFGLDLVWVEQGLAGMRAAQGRFPEAEDYYRRAIGIMDHHGEWKEEADLLEALAAVYEKDGKPAAGEAREKAKSLRDRP